jgi:uncharacterized repeat protein (TIGR02543 family)
LETVLELPLREASETVFLGKGKITKILGAALASALMLSGAFSLSTKAPEKVGATSYNIGSASDFATYFNNSSAHAADDFTLTADISIGNLNYYGINSAAYTGTFNGNGHTITMTLNAANSGLFYQIGSTGSVTNLTVTATAAVSACCAPICFSNSGTVSNCTSNMALSSPSNTIGGMAWGAAAGTWSNCTVNWTIPSGSASSNTLYRVAPEGQGTFTSCHYSLLESAADTNFTPATGSLISKVGQHSSANETKLYVLFTTTSYWLQDSPVTDAYNSSSQYNNFWNVWDTNFTIYNSRYSVVTIDGATYYLCYFDSASSGFTLGSLTSPLYLKRLGPSGAEWGWQITISSLSDITGGSSNTITITPTGWGNTSGNNACTYNTAFGCIYKSTLVEQATAGTNTSIYSYQKYVSGTNYAPTVTNTPSGYTFAGWYTDSTYTTAYTAAPMTADLTLYAKYTAASHSVHEYAVYDGYSDTEANYLTYASSLKIRDETSYSDTAFTPATPSASGYSFDGWYYDPAATSAYTATTLTAEDNLYAKFTSNLSTEAIYLVGSDWGSWLIHFPSNRFTYNSTSGLYELNNVAITANCTFKFFDKTKNVWGGYLAQAFNNGFTGSTDADITCSTAGTYNLSILKGIESASSNYYGYWNYAKLASDDYSTANIYLRGSMNNWGDYSAYKFTYSGGQYNLNVTLNAGDTFKYYYNDNSKNGWGGYNSVYLGTTNFRTEGTGENSNVYVINSGSYHLVIRGSVVETTSSSAFQDYWLGGDTTTTVTRYLKEYQVTGSNVATTNFNIESVVSGSAFTPTTPASSLTPSGYEFEGWYTDSACTTAYVSGSAISADAPLYAHYQTATFKYVYFNFISASITPTNLRVRMWYGTTELLSNATGEAVASSSNVSIASSSTSLKMSNNPGLSLMVKIKISNAIISAAGGNQIYIEFRDDSGNATTPSTAVDAAKYVENGYYWHSGGSDANYGGHIDADHDAAYAYCYEMDAKRKALSETAGAQSICNFSSTVRSDLLNAYNALSTAAQGYVNASQMNEVTKANGDAKGSTEIYTYTGASAYTSFQAIIAQLTAMAQTSGSGARSIGNGANPTSTTLIIVAASGTAGLLGIATIYLLSKRRRKRRYHQA